MTELHTQLANATRGTKTQTFGKDFYHAKIISLQNLFILLSGKNHWHASSLLQFNIHNSLVNYKSYKGTHTALESSVILSGAHRALLQGDREKICSHLFPISKFDTYFSLTLENDVFFLSISLGITIT